MSVIGQKYQQALNTFMSAIADTPAALKNGWSHVKNGCNHIKKSIAESAPFKLVSTRLCHSRTPTVKYFGARGKTEAHATVLAEQKEAPNLQEQVENFTQAIIEANSKIKTLNNLYAGKSEKLLMVENQLSTAQRDIQKLDTTKKELTERLEWAAKRNVEKTEEANKLKHDLKEMTAILNVVGGLTTQIQSKLPNDH